MNILTLTFVNPPGRLSGEDYRGFLVCRTLKSSISLARFQLMPDHNSLDQTKSCGPSKIALFDLGFRPFFLGAALFAILSICFWILGYFGWISLNWNSISTFQWHAHEMVFGYSTAVIAGFLLTAVSNWTGTRTLHGWSLALLFFIWLLARITFLLGEKLVLVTACLDTIFSVVLLAAVTIPIAQSRQWKQMAILSKLLIIVVFNACFYLGVFNYLDNGIDLGIYGGFYMVIGLILTLGRRVVPFFIERGVGYKVQLINSKLLDFSSLVLYVAFFIAEVFLKDSTIAGGLALGMLLVNGVRLLGWHTQGIWKNAMLWSLYLSMWFICLGFLLFGLSSIMGISKFLAIHAFAFGGIGLVTMGMMARVSLGHTGRSVTSPPKSIKIALLLILFGGVVRVLFPLISVSLYTQWIVASQIIWIAAFGIFASAVTPILIKPRIDEAGS